MSAVNTATDITMNDVILANATVLGLSVGEDSDYKNLNNANESGRDLAVALDVFYSKPDAGYAKDTLKATFDRAVESRKVIKEVMASVYSASTHEEMGISIADHFYTDLITDLTTAKEVYSHQGNKEIVNLLNESMGLPALKKAYTELTPENQTVVNEAVLASQLSDPAISWSGIHAKITQAISELGN